MTREETPMPDVPGARPHCERDGRGPVLIMIPGAAGCAETYRTIAAQLAPNHTVVVYDRRGFSHSTVHGAQRYDRHLDTGTDDIATRGPRRRRSAWISMGR
jgi:pimeloyl-ACP methyl ester carboxylesterase